MKRRNFLTTSILAGMASCTFLGSRGANAQPTGTGSDTSLSTSAPGDRRAQAKLRFSSQLRPWIPGKDDAEKMVQMKKWGFEAVEPQRGVVDNVKEFKKMADDAGLLVSVICGSSSGGKVCSGDAEERRLGADEMRRALEAAAILECNGAILAPAFNKDQERIGRTNLEIRRALIDIDPNTKEIKGGCLKELGDFAASLKTNIVLEPLNRKESWFLRQVADAASICRDSQSEGVKTMGDFYHMYYEEPCDMAAFIAGGDFVKHVHFGSGNKRVMPGQDSTQTFVAGFRGLKFIGYKEFMSFECGCLGGDAKGITEVPRVLEYLKSQWNEA